MLYTIILVVFLLFLLLCYSYVKSLVLKLLSIYTSLIIFRLFFVARKMGLKLANLVLKDLVLPQRVPGDVDST